MLKQIVCKDHLGKEINAYVPEGYEDVARKILASPIRPVTGLSSIGDGEEFFVRVFQRLDNNFNNDMSYEVQLIDGADIPEIRFCGEKL